MGEKVAAPNICDKPESDKDDNSEIYESVEAEPSHTQAANNAFVAPDNQEGDDNG